MVHTIMNKSILNKLLHKSNLVLKKYHIVIDKTRLIKLQSRSMMGLCHHRSVGFYPQLHQLRTAQKNINDVWRDVLWSRNDLAKEMSRTISCRVSR